MMTVTSGTSVTAVSFLTVIIYRKTYFNTKSMASITVVRFSSFVLPEKMETATHVMTPSRMPSEML